MGTIQSEVDWDVYRSTPEKIIAHCKKEYNLDLTLNFSMGLSAIVRNKQYEAMLCDYRTLEAYKVDWCIAVYDRNDDHMVYRANVPRYSK
tara:strand:+ start:26 stop:295 length:270 start_codon:yes stop_codon:yes gene_type:complete